MSTFEHKGDVYRISGNGVFVPERPTRLNPAEDHTPHLTELSEEGIAKTIDFIGQFRIESRQGRARPGMTKHPEAHSYPLKHWVERWWTVNTWAAGKSGITEYVSNGEAIEACVRLGLPIAYTAPDTPNVTFKIALEFPIKYETGRGINRDR